MKEGLENLFAGCMVYVLVILLVPALVGAAYMAIKDSPEIPNVPAPSIEKIPDEIICYEAGYSISGFSNLRRYDGRFCNYTQAVKACNYINITKSIEKWDECMAHLAPANPARFGFHNLK